MERVQLIEAEWGLRISNYLLWHFYRKHGIKFRTGKEVYRAETAQSALVRRRRLVFAKLLATLINRGKPIIYCDETTYNTWQLKAKSWSLNKNALVHARNNKRMGKTVYGAIGHCLNNPVFKLGRTTN